MHIVFLLMSLKLCTLLFHVLDLSTNTCALEKFVKGFTYVSKGRKNYKKLGYTKLSMPIVRSYAHACRCMHLPGERASTVNMTWGYTDG